MTAASGGPTPPPPISIDTSHIASPPPSSLAVSRRGFTGFEPFQWTCHVITAAHGDVRSAGWAEFWRVECAGQKRTEQLYWLQSVSAVQRAVAEA